jgi:two-component system alkaline phosphatase synthesis response regulator PhoP
MNRRKILVVDDDRVQQQAMAHRLRASGYDVAFAEDGIQAIAQVRREKPDLVLLDIGLPGGDGFTVIKRLKVMNLSAGVPIVVVSARDPQVASERALTTGADAYFAKPVPYDELMATIRRLLGEAPGEIPGEAQSA